MQMIDAATFKGAKATDRRALAILAYDNATAEPESANWRAVADMLRLAMPSTKAKVPEPDSHFAPWADYEIPRTISGAKLGRSPVLVVTFADGEIVRCPAVSLAKKPLNIGRGLRVAVTFYRARLAQRMRECFENSERIMVPDFVSIVCETTGAEFDPAICNANTAAGRAGSFDVAAARKAAEAYPERTDDGTIDRAGYLRAAYLLSIARDELAALPSDADRHALTYRVEELDLMIAGWSYLQIRAKWHDDDTAARKAESASPPTAPAPQLAPVASRRFLSSTAHSRPPKRVPVAPARKSPPFLRVVA